jgi:hypothetical protein
VPRPALTRLAESPGIQPQDPLINCLVVERENRSFGPGAAQYA